MGAVLHAALSETGGSSRDEYSDAEAAEEVVSVFDVSDGPVSEHLETDTRGLLAELRRQQSGDGQALWETSMRIWSGTSSAFTSSPRAGTRPSTRQREEAAESALLDGSLGAMLRRLTLENQLLDESVTSSVQRVLQLGAVLSGQRLSDEEISGLPKVRFESAEEQHCSICLENYQEGELLTALRCGHFFHVECLTHWMHRATICPLCRNPCVEQAE